MGCIIWYCTAVLLKRTKTKKEKKRVETVETENDVVPVFNVAWRCSFTT